MGKLIEFPGVGLVNMINAEDEEQDLLEGEQMEEVENTPEPDVTGNTVSLLDTFQALLEENNKLRQALEVAGNLTVAMLMKTRKKSVDIDQNTIKKTMECNKTFNLKYNEGGSVTVHLVDVTQNV
jgi:hypothetical protein